MYWGLYNMVERPDDDYMAVYFGGDDANWFYRNHGDAENGDWTRWNYLLNTLTTRDQSVPANYAELQGYLDPQAFADYLILSWWFGITDWPNNNYYVANRNTAGADTATPSRYFAWDGEWSLDRKLGGLTPGAWVHPGFLPGVPPTSDMAKLWQAIRQNPSFMTLFANRVALHTGPGGALADSAIRRRA